MPEKFARDKRSSLFLASSSVTKKKTVFCTIDASSPRQSFRRASVGVTSPSSGVAPIATQEHLDEEDLEEVDNADSKSNDNAVDGKN